MPTASRLIAAAAALAAAFTQLPRSTPHPVLTSQYDNARTGAILTETLLTPANVNARSFGKLLSLPVDGDVYAQPLFVPGVSVPGQGSHDVVIVATEHDSVYAFDALGQPAQPLWKTSLLGASSGASTVPERDVNCPFIQTEVGITPTPAIDLASGTIFVLARTKISTGLASSRYVQALHALALTTGAEKLGGPVEITAPDFNPLRENPRAGLLVSGGQVYLTWASSCDVEPYHGFVMAYDATTLKQTAILNVTPGGTEGGIWQSDNAPAADEAGDVYAVTGNGTFDATTNNYGDTALRLHLSGTHLVVADSYTPTEQAEMSRDDLDFGSGGPSLIPAPPGGHPLLVAGGKDGQLRVVDRTRMKTALQVIKLGGGIYGAAASWNGHAFVLASNDTLKDFAVGPRGLTLAKTGTKKFDNPGATPAISANGQRDAIVWLLETKLWNAFRDKRPSVLYAFDAADIGHELYTSASEASRDRIGPTLRFTVPTVANGHVYVGAKSEVDVFGLLK